MKRSLALAFAFFATLSVVVLQPVEDPVEAASGFTALSEPVRFLNTRDTGIRIGDETLAGSGTYQLQVTGQNGVPSGVTAVAMNLTVTDTRANDFGGYATVYPCGSVPDASNLNFVTGQTIANSVIAPLSSSGALCISVYGAAHVLVDISGYFTAGFTALAEPARFLNTRDTGARIGDGALVGSGEYVLQVTGRNGVPAGVSAVAMNLTVTSTETNDFGGFATVYPCGVVPNASNLNFTTGQTIANSVVAPLSSAGQLCISVYGLAHVLVDISGYFTAGFASLAQPARFLNTRDSGIRVGDETLAGSGTYTLQVTGREGVPAGVTAVAMNLTVTSTQTNDYGGFATVYPCGSVPDASNLNFITGQTIANSVIAPLSSSGAVCISVYGAAHVLADISGYMSDIADGSADSGAVVNPGVGALSFDLSGAVAVGIANTAMTRTVHTRDARGKVVAQEAESNLIAVEADGGTRAAVDSGSASVSRLLVAPNDKLYVLFNQRVNLADTSIECQQFTAEWPPRVYEPEWVNSGGYWSSNSVERVLDPGWYRSTELPTSAPDGSQSYTYWTLVPCDEPPCLLGEIDVESGDIVCVDNTLSSIWWNDWDSTAHPAIQFDDEGRVYYQGSDSSYTGVLRRFDGSRVEDLITDNVNISNFMVTGDSRIFYSGSTSAGNTSYNWFRVQTPNSSGDYRTREIQRGSVSWFEEFPDGNIYFASDYSSVKRWMSETQTVDTENWLFQSEGDVMVNRGETDPWGPNTWSEYDYSNLPSRAAAAIEGCYQEQDPVTAWKWNPDTSEREMMEVGDPYRWVSWESSPTFCTSPTSLRMRLHQTMDGEVYGLSGESWSSTNYGAIVQYYPTPKVYQSTVRNPTVVLPVLSYMFIAGTDASGRYILTRYDLTGVSERTLIEPEDEIEIFRMYFNAAENSLVFDGVRFADSKYVVGRVDLRTGDVVASQTGSQRLVDFSLLSS